MTSKAESHYQTMLLEKIFELLTAHDGMSDEWCSQILSELKDNAAKAAEIQDEDEDESELDTPLHIYMN